MNIRMHRFRFDAFLGAAFTLVMTSGLMLLWRTSHGWGALHRLSSAVLILGVVIHGLLHRKWIRHLLHLRPKPVKARRHLWTDWALLLLFLLVLVSAPDGGDDGSVLRLHLVSGLAMAILASVHLALHRTWIVSTWNLPRNRTSSDAPLPGPIGRKPPLLGE